MLGKSWDCLSNIVAGMDCESDAGEVMGLFK